MLRSAGGNANVDNVNNDGNLNNNNVNNNNAVRPVISSYIYKDNI
ncbi:MAG: hypothetical protein SPF04_03980 [Bacilli bacterium]|nr:hypothetical protein [Bacilli bacterium]